MALSHMPTVYQNETLSSELASSLSRGYMAGLRALPHPKGNCERNACKLKHAAPNCFWPLNIFLVFSFSLLQRISSLWIQITGCKHSLENMSTWQKGINSTFKSLRKKWICKPLNFSFSSGHSLYHYLTAFYCDSKDFCI